MVHLFTEETFGKTLLCPAEPYTDFCMPKPYRFYIRYQQLWQEILEPLNLAATPKGAAQFNSLLNAPE